MVWILNHLRLSNQRLYPVATTVLGGNGFLAVYVAGVVMGSFRFACRETIVSFHDGLSWLMQIAMFLILGLLVFPINADRLGRVSHYLVSLVCGSSC